MHLETFDLTLINSIFIASPHYGLSSLYDYPYSQCDVAIPFLPVGIGLLPTCEILPLSLFAIILKASLSIPLYL